MPDTFQYIDVAIPLPVYQTYTYRVPEHLIPFAETGKRVLVPFGRRGITGYIIETRTVSDHEDPKQIFDILDNAPLFPVSMVPLFKWIADYYIHPIGDVIKTALPGGINPVDIVSFSITKKGEKCLAGHTATPLEKNILQILRNKSESIKHLRHKTHADIPMALMLNMEKQRLVFHERKFKDIKPKEKTEPYVAYQNSDIPADKFFEKRSRILNVLKIEGELSVNRLNDRIPGAKGYLNYLEKEGCITADRKRVFRDPLGDPVEPDTPPVLTEEQRHAVSAIIGSLGKGYSTCLLTGITGSGKTEVYMRVAAEAVKQGHAVIVLVPEIALISQTEHRFRARFGNRIAVLHSGLSVGERFDQWTRVLNNDVNIVIGTRSAVFAPFTKTGIIIVDEEHDMSYKQDSRLRYNARDIAVMRAKFEQGVALLGSATPSIQSYYNAVTKKFTSTSLKNRINKQSLPDISMVDLRNHRDMRGIRRFITPELSKAIKETLGRKEQALLFLNRRGFAGFPVCAACGTALRCKNCDITMTLHRKENAFKCHFCGFSMASVSVCGACGSAEINLLGLGTEKVEAAVQSLFPDAVIERLDRDTTSRKGSVIRILKRLKEGKIDILIGTQMITKGHDFPNITLVGIICADLSLNFPDFRSGEQTFQLLAQVAGRAGRGEAAGKVILQTYNPEHYSIVAATHQHYKEFFDKEITFRKSLNYPPFARLIQLKISGADQKETAKHAEDIGKQCALVLRSNNDYKNAIEVLGPIESPIQKIAGKYRWQTLLKSKNVSKLHAFLHDLLSGHPFILTNRNVTVAIDVDPVFMM